jgi:hypothetical protein
VPCRSEDNANDDQIAGGSNWLYMTLRRLGRRDDTPRRSRPIVAGMKVKDGLRTDYAA